MIVAKYDIWAERGVSVVWSDPEIRAFDPWLVNYANEWLVMARDNPPPFVPPYVFLGLLRRSLGSRVEHWKAEARRYVAEARRYVASQEAPEKESVAKQSENQSGAPEASRANAVDRGVTEGRAVEADPKESAPAAAEVLLVEGDPPLTASASWLKDRLREAKPGESLTAEASAVATPNASTAPKPLKAQEWEDIEISFIGDHDAEIRVPGAWARNLNYKEIEGFEDRRTGRPSMQWAMLRLFGTFPDGAMPDRASNSKEWLALQKTIERTSKALRKYFRMTGDPFPYVQGKGYCARIKIRKAPDSAG